MARYQTSTRANHPGILEKVVEVLTLGVGRAESTYHTKTTDTKTGKSSTGFGYSKGQAEKNAWKNLKR